MSWWLTAICPAGAEPADLRSRSSSPRCTQHSVLLQALGAALFCILSISKLQKRTAYLCILNELGKNKVLVLILKIAVFWTDTQNSKPVGILVTFSQTETEANQQKEGLRTDLPAAQESGFEAVNPSQEEPVVKQHVYTLHMHIQTLCQKSPVLEHFN